MPRNRPFGVNVIALMQVLNGLTVAASILLTDNATVEYLAGAENTFGLSFGLINFVIAIGLWMLWRWAWVFTMIWTGLNLAGGLVAYYQGDPNYVSMLLNVFIVFYLNQRDVQQAFANNHAPGQEDVPRAAE